MTRIHAYVVKRAQKRYVAIRDLYRGRHFKSIEELVHAAVNDEIISTVEGQDILDLYENGELGVQIDEEAI